MVNEIKLSAEETNTSEAIRFAGEELERMDAPESAKTAIAIMVEEVFLNISDYAYGDDPGNVKIIMETDENACSITMTFVDKGVEFDPTAKDDPNVDLPIEERPIGGLGIFMVKNMMDNVTYSRENGENRLKIDYSWKE